MSKRTDRLIFSWIKAYVMFFFLAGAPLLLSIGIFAQPIDDVVLKSVIQITTSTGKTGTGFLFGSKIHGSGDQRGMPLFVVTNRHMLADYNPIDGDFGQFDWITLYLYRNAPMHDGPVEKVQVNLKAADGKFDMARVAVHANGTVDVAAVRMDDVVEKHLRNLGRRLNSKILHHEWLEPFANLPGSYGYIGGRVFALGYPHGITSLLTNHPIAKAGHLAATAGEELALNTYWPTPRRKRKDAEITIRGKLLLIDGLIVGGNSGGPVILPGGGGLFGRDPKTGETVMQSHGPTKILGIVSAGWTTAGLSYAYATDYIKEVIDTFLTRNAAGSKTVQ